MLAAVPVLLLIPLTGMAMSEQVRWSVLDFAIMGLMLCCVAFAVELVLRRFRTTRMRLVLCAGVLLCFAVVWAELAVGVFNSPWAGS